MRSRGGTLLVLALVVASFAVSGSSPAAGDTALYRVDAGGAGVTGWSSDSATAPSPYSNSSATKTASTTATIDTSDPS
ncbi:MAG: hypothetical protein M3M94_00620, partial [Actinomycetota bacterium]|nr:hypothetical protein [Actinomycetota bacterium]